MEPLLEQLKTAFKESRFDEARRLIGEIKKTDPENALAGHIEKKILDQEAKAKEKLMKEEAKVKETQEKETKKQAELAQKKADEEAKAAKKLAEQQAKEAQKAEELKVKAAAEETKRQEKLAKEAAKQKQKEEEATAKKAAQEAKERAKTEAKAAKEAAKKAAEANRVPWSVRWGKAKESVKAAFQKLKSTKTEKPQAPSGSKGVTLIPSVAPQSASGEAGNIFTKLFQKKEEETKEESIIDTIVAQTEAKTEEKKPEVPGAKMRALARLTFQFSVVFVLITAAFLYTQVIDKSNTILGLFNVENNVAGRLHGASETLTDREEQEKEIKKEIGVYEKGYNNQYEKMIQKVVNARIDWTDVMNKIGEVADSVYEHNALSQYIKFSSYSFNAEKKQVSVSGTLSDPLGQNLTKLAELEEAFRYYPGDPGNPDDKTAPYFYNLEASNNVGKSFSAQNNKYVSNFRFTFYLEKQAEAKKSKSKKK